MPEPNASAHPKLPETQRARARKQAPKLPGMSLAPEGQSWVLRVAEAREAGRLAVPLFLFLLVPTFAGMTPMHAGRDALVQAHTYTTAIKRARCRGMRAAMPTPCLQISAAGSEGTWGDTSTCGNEVCSTDVAKSCRA